MYSVRLWHNPQAEPKVQQVIVRLVIKGGSMKGTFTLYYHIFTLQLPSNIARVLDGAQSRSHKAAWNAI